MSKKTKDWGKVREESEAPKAAEPVKEPAKEQSAPEALDHPSYAILEERLTEAEQKARNEWEKSMRMQAELDNVRRRTDREIANAHRYGIERFASDCLPILDSLESAMQIAKDHNDSSMREGIELTMKLFVDVLKKHQIEEIDPLGMSFNPAEHEAMAMQEAPDAEPNTVITVFQKGYRLHDRVIRPARVIVAKE